MSTALNTAQFGNLLSTALNTSATNLLWLDDKEVGSSLSLKEEEEYSFQCRVYGARPAATIVWTVNGTVKVETGRDNGTNTDARLIDSNSTLTLTIPEGETSLSCKATVPADATGVSDSVTITATGKFAL